MKNSTKFWLSIIGLILLYPLVLYTKVFINVAFVLFFILFGTYLFVSLVGYDWHDKDMYFTILGKYNFVYLIKQFNKYLDNLEI